MDIDLKWLLPFVLPFAIFALIGAVTWAAGVEYTEEGRLKSAVASIGVGAFLGVLALILVEKPITIRKILGGK